MSLGGSRAAGTAGPAGPDSDWDFAVYYRGAGFDPAGLRSLGWPGEIFPIGGWGGGVFNGGAWLTAGARRIDVHYRDLDDVEHHLAEAQAGRFGIERLLFHLAGIPTYIVAAELALNQVLQRPDGRATPGPPWDTRAARTRPGGTWPTPPGPSPSPHARAPMPCWPPEGSGSPTKRPSSTGPACAASTESLPVSPLSPDTCSAPSKKPPRSYAPQTDRHTAGPAATHICRWSCGRQGRPSPRR